ncbi:MAG TPA: hypothetical protein VEV62_00955 [Parafilimonas sp.]|jgi:hypothetical protein|nr:hypothetical protein [Parafilimonas sp.]
MKKQTTILAVILVLISGITEAQYYGGGIYLQRGYRRPPRPIQRYQRYPRQKQRQQTYHPTVNLSFGYGYPNLDKNYFPSQFNGAVNAYEGNTFKQTGPVTGALDFQFSKYNSIGVMGTYGKVSVPYYDFNSNSNIASFNGDIKSWSVLFNMMTYFPSYETVSPYIRTAIGISTHNEDYTYPDGSKAVIGGNNLTDLAYQVSIGARFNMSPNAGFFLEAGYGRYIASGGLTFRF